MHLYWKLGKMIIYTFKSNIPILYVKKYQCVTLNLEQHFKNTSTIVETHIKKKNI